MRGLQVQARMANTRQTLAREVQLTRQLVSDVTDRFMRGSEPTLSRGLGGVFGTRGNLVAEPVAFVAKTVDNVVDHVHRAAQINRSTLNY